MELVESTLTLFRSAMVDREEGVDGTRQAPRVS